MSTDIIVIVFCLSVVSIVAIVHRVRIRSEAEVPPGRVRIETSPSDK